MAEFKGATEIVCGSHIFEVIGYSTIKGIGTGKYIRSSSFNVGGHDWVIQFFPNGSHSYTTNYASIYLKLLNPSSKVTIMYSFSVRMRDKSFYSDISSNSMSSATMQTIEPENPIVGIPYFIRRADLASTKYLSDDSLTFRCILWVCTDISPIPTLPVPVPNSEPPIPASNLAVHFCQMLESGQGADVKFLVSDKTFSAHKCVLAARSPVFQDQFFGEKTDLSIDIGSIVVENMETLTFEALLQFIYTDSLPDSVDIIVAQNLLVASDRYRLESLKMICERRLCQEIALNNLVTILTFAEEHKCEQLRGVCMEFATKKENYAALLLMDGFDELKGKCPSVIKELMEKGNK